jgi:hypothetical protein
MSCTLDTLDQLGQEGKADWHLFEYLLSNWHTDIQNLTLDLLFAYETQFRRQLRQLPLRLYYTTLDCGPH